MNKHLRTLLDIELNEISVVDRPAQEGATMSIEKAAKDPRPLYQRAAEALEGLARAHVAEGRSPNYGEAYAKVAEQHPDVYAAAIAGPTHEERTAAVAKAATDRERALAELDRLTKARTDRTGENHYEAYAEVAGEHPDVYVRAAACRSPHEQSQALAKTAGDREAALVELDALTKARTDRTGENYYQVYGDVCAANPDVYRRAMGR